MKIVGLYLQPHYTLFDKEKQDYFAFYEKNFVSMRRRW